MKTRTYLLTVGALACLAVIAIAAVWRIRSASRRVNVLLITLDTTRSDRLSCYGYTNLVTAGIDHVARNGVMFTRAYCSVPLTLPSHATILTGLLPPEHGLHVNALGALPEGVPVLAEILRESGYETGAFVASPVLGAKFGLARGFDVYDDQLRTDQLAGSEALRYRPAEHVVAPALQWLRNRGSRRFFCWVHLYDPHWPYDSHETLFGAKYAKAPYDAEIAYADRYVARLLALVQEHGLEGRTLIVVAGDHGESLDGEHGEPRPYHGFMLYEPTMRVPLIFSLPGYAREGTKADVTVTLADVMPTVLDVVGLPVPPGVSGRSLAPVLMGRRIPEAGPVYGETKFPASFGWSPLQCLITPSRKYIRTPIVELYDLDADPAEARNLAPSRPDEVSRLESELSAIEDKMTVTEATEVSLTEEEKRRLESLGYAGGTGPVDAAGDSGPRDIKQVVHLIDLSAEATDLMTKGDYAESHTRWERIVAESPDSPTFRNSLGVVLLHLGALDAAKEHFEFVVHKTEEAGSARPFLASDGHRPLRPIALNNLAYCLSLLGRFEDALPFAGEAVAADEERSEFHHTLAGVYVGLSRNNDALSEARLAVSLGPPKGEHFLLLAQLLTETPEQHETAAESLRKAVRIGLSDQQQAMAEQLLRRLGTTDNSE